jgi:hypothetical protein
MSEQPSQKIQPWKALSSSSLAEDKNPDFSKRNLRANETTCSMGASVSKPMDRKTEHLKKDVVGDKNEASDTASSDKVAEKVTTNEESSDDA